MLTYTLNKKQYSALEGLAFWIASESKTRERSPQDIHELNKCKNTICLCIFPELDALAVPFWVQNSVICWAENWRNLASGYLCDFLKSKNVFIAS